MKENKDKDSVLSSTTEKDVIRTCDVCGNDMKLIKTTSGRYWLCKVCNSTQMDY